MKVQTVNIKMADNKLESFVIMISEKCPSNGVGLCGEPMLLSACQANFDGLKFESTHRS